VVKIQNNLVNSAIVGIFPNLDHARTTPMVESPREEGVLEVLRRRTREFVEKERMKQSNLAEECGVSGPELSNFLNDKRSLQPWALANLAERMQINVASALVAAELARANSPGESKSPDSDPPAKKKGLESVEEAYRSILKGLSFISVAPGQKTLHNWRDWFFPAAVFVGDRREDSPPRSPTDLLATSSSAADYFNFSFLQLPNGTEIVSDKTLLLPAEETAAAMQRLRNRFGDKNLLVIGSPASNLATRALNRGACFSFSCSAEAMQVAGEIEKEVEPFKLLPANLEDYARSHIGRLRRMQLGFARSGILDPSYDKDRERLRGIRTNTFVDYGAVSFARHPWSEKHVAILVGGLHGPGTAMAVKVLSQRDAFVERPLGGVFKVHVPNDLPWDERFRHLSWAWDTDPYTLEQYTKKFDEFAHSLDEKAALDYPFWDSGQVRRLLELMRTASDR
jgi:hypothetical protein